MKVSKNKWLWLMGLSSIALVVLCAYFGSAEAGVALATANIITSRSRASLSANREDTDFETGIALLDPNENPFTSITMIMGKKTASTVDYHWFEDELIPEAAQVNDTGLDASSTTITVDDGTHFAVGDIVRHDLTNENMLVTAISTHDLTVIRDYGAAEGWTEGDAAIADNDWLTIIGNAFEQGHTLPGMRSTAEVEYKNYCQDVRTPFGISEIANASAHRGEDDWPFQRRKNGITHQRKLEYMNLWGKPYAGDLGYFSGTHGSGDAPTMAGGINYFIDRYTDSVRKLDETDLTEDEFEDWLEYLFEYGSDIRYCFCNPRMRTIMDKWGKSKLNTFVRDTVYGMKVARYQSSHGDVVFKTHKQMKRNQSTDYFYSFFLDFDEFQWVSYATIGSTRLRVLDPYAATGETGMKEEYQTIGCVKYGMANKHGRLRWKTYS